ncbi:hypothetical protein CDV31_009244 [Fusarium ambrosium]|uniref:Heterokaryon incompatibility domain-containing protein n=1 Tax=Fusarium ambrosium TaxID=131363 RepID=A0A428TVR1_9HYPO|nr:hypothetical protein CDV31_009244 [Fusarium ambrosium]
MPSSTLKPYVYQSLGNQEVSIIDHGFTPFDSFMIRVIVLEPAADTDADLHCTIEHYDVSITRWDSRYDAISYTWGPPIFSHTLYVGNSKISITPTLDQALRRFRKPDMKRRLWADAVCINQKDSKELGQQVQRMGQIYLNAGAVLVWLGDAEKMDQCINFFWGLSSSGHEASTTSERADESIREEMVRFFGHEDFATVQRFLRLKWFTRRWVIQEAVTKAAHFYCGNLDITSHALNHALFILNKSTFNFDRRILDHMRFLELAVETWEHSTATYPMGILDLLVRFGGVSCTDDRDRIYAFLGMADDVKSPYAKTILQHKQHLDLLHCAGAFRPPVASMLKLYQSWIPDFRIPMRYRPFLSVPWFNAGGPPQEEKPFVNHPLCSANGFIFDTRVMPPLADLCSVLGMSGRYITGERIWQVLGLTFIADHALNDILLREYEQRDRYNGKLMKRNARERDMHTFLDWWTNLEDEDQAEESENQGSARHQAIQNIVKKHQKSLHRSSCTGLFLKTGASENEWGPTSYEVQSHWHSRVDDELEPYFMETILSHVEETKEKQKEPKVAGLITDGNETNSSDDHKAVVPKKRGKVDHGAYDTREDAPMDCEWRHHKGGIIYMDAHRHNHERYTQAAHNTLCGRSFFITSKGWIGIGPDDMAPGDTAAISYGARTPFILRPEEHSKWRLVGDSYIHGIMGGEALVMSDRAADRKFVLV